MQKTFPFGVCPNSVEALVHIDPSLTHREFMLARASAIEQYAYIEQILCTLCAHLMDAPVDVVGVMFYKMNNARARLDALERLLKKKHGNKYNSFWNSLVKYLKSIDQKRNLIVHWTTEKTSTSEGKSWTCLVSLNYWDKKDDPEKIYLEDLYNFALVSNFFYHLIQHFVWVISESPKKIDSSWSEICLQPIDFPPPNTHPLHYIIVK